MSQERVKKLQALMREMGMDCAVAIPGPNLFYLTGLEMKLSERITAALFPVDGEPRLILPLLERPHAEHSIQIDAQFITYRDGEGPDGAFQRTMGDLALNGKSIGVEYQNMRVLELDQLKQSAPQARFTSLEDVIGRLRIIKDAGEIANMREAIRLTEIVLEKGIASIKIGMSEAEIARFFQLITLENDAGSLPFPPIVVSGPNGGSPHAVPGDRRIQAGDIITIDFGLVYENYPGDITRNVAVGSPDPELEKIHEIVKDANAAGRAACGPGVPAQEADRASRAVIEEAGYGEYFIHRTGHGLGIEIHEPPYIIEGNELELQPGMTFTVEPGVYLPGKGGVRVEDDMLLTADGVESLTQFPRELKQIS